MAVYMVMHARVVCFAYLCDVRLRKSVFFFLNYWRKRVSSTGVADRMPEDTHFKNILVFLCPQKQTCHVEKIFQR